MKSHLRVYNKKGVAQLIVPVILLGLAIAIMISFNTLQGHSSTLSINELEVEPTKFKSSQNGVMTMQIENHDSKNSVSVVMYFETHENVALYQRINPLPKIQGNYTFTKNLEPLETSTLKFNIKGTIDTGDNSREYYVKVFCLINGKTHCSKTTEFTITKK